VGIQKVKALRFVGTQKMEADFVGHGIGVPKTGVRTLNSPVADNNRKTGLAKYALVPRLGVGFGHGTEHCMLGSEVGP